MFSRIIFYNCGQCVYQLILFSVYASVSGGDILALFVKFLLKIQVSMFAAFLSN